MNVQSRLVTIHYRVWVLCGATAVSLLIRTILKALR